MINLDEIQINKLQNPEDTSMTNLKQMDIAVIGISLETAEAENIDEFWDNIKAGKDCIRDFPSNRKKDCDSYLQLKGIKKGTAEYGVGSYIERVDAFDYSFFNFSPKEASLMSPNQRIFLECVWKAIESAGYGGERLRGSNTGVYLGHSVGTLVDAMYDYSSFIPLIDPESTPMAIAGNLPSIIASRISYILDLKGPSIALDTACSSSLVAIHYACQDLKNGKCDMAIAGGVKVNLFPLIREYKMGIESSDGRAKTFDDSSDGTGRGEGVAAIILKPLKQALRDQDNIYGVIKGSAVNQDGSSIGITAPNALAQENAIIKAWEDAKIDPQSVSYIEAHGTGTKLGDPIEIDGIKRAFSHYTNKKQFCAIGAVKTNIGHLDNASGIIGVIKCILAMKNEEIPPIVNFKYPNRKIDFADSPVYVNTRLCKWETGGKPIRCGVNSFGLSGTNCHLVLEAAPKQQRNTSLLDRNIFAISAKSKWSLSELVKDYYEYFISKTCSFDSVCYTANTGRFLHPYRIAIIANDINDLIHKLQNIIENGYEQDLSINDIYYCHVQEENSIVNPDTYAKTYSAYMQDLAEAKKICKEYLKNRSFNWLKLYGKLSFIKCELPTYPFERKRCWLEVADNIICENNSNTINLAKKNTVVLKGMNRDADEIEQKVADIWGNTLGFRELDCNNSFVTLGGDSIIALKVMNEINKAFMIQSQVIDLLKKPILNDYIQLLREKYLGSRTLQVDKYCKLERSEYYPVSVSEKMVFVQEQYGNLGSAYNIPIVLHMNKLLDIEKVKASFEKIIELNEALRTSFDYCDGQIVQKVLDSFQLEFIVHESTVQKEYLSFIKPFDLFKAPLFRVHVINQSNDKTSILIDMHHIIADGKSVSIILKEFFDLYVGKVISAPDIQYKEYSVWQTSMLVNGGFKEQEAYWVNKLNRELPKLRMPLDYQRGNSRNFDGNSYEFIVSQEITAKLENIAQEKNMTLNNVLFGLYGLLIKKYTKQKEVIIGLVTSGRTDYQVLQTVGMFNNFVPVCIECDNDLSIDQYLDLVNQELILDYENQEYPYEAMLEVMDIQVEKSRNPIFDTVYIFHNEFDTQLNIMDSNLSCDIKQVNTNTSKLDFKIDIFVKENKELYCILEYAKSLFKEETMQQLSSSFTKLVLSVVDNTSIMLGDIKLFTQEEEKTLEEKRDLNDSIKEIKAIVASTFTSEPIGDYIAWWGNKFNYPIDITFTSYNQVFQELLDEESAISKNKGINILLVRFEDWIRNNKQDDRTLCQEIEKNFNELVTILKDKDKKATYLVGLFPVATHLKLDYKVRQYIIELTKRWKSILESMNKVYVVDFTNISKSYGIKTVFDSIKDDIGHLPFSDEFYAAIGTEISRKICSLYNASKFKVIALDADNTLWDGVCGEVGEKGIQLSSNFLKLQQFMLDRYKEGMLLVICSKNNEQDVWDVFENNPAMILKKEHFVSRRINWSPKSRNLKEMADELNLGIDSFVFIDDSVSECSEVIANCPEVLTLNLPDDSETYSSFLKHAWCFDRLNVTEEDQNRSKMYVTDKKRKQAQENTKSLDGFLKDLNLVMIIHDIEEHEYPRIAQLLQRTNQFNLSTIRRSEQELRELVGEQEYRCLTIKVSDQFGDYGIVGALILRYKENGELFIDTFLLSCRILGRKVEDAVLKYIVDSCISEKLTKLTALYVESKKNKPFWEFLLRTHWETIETNDIGLMVEFDFKEQEIKNEYITVLAHDLVQPKNTNSEISDKIFGVLDHVAVAVETIPSKKTFYEEMGYLCSNLVEDKLQNAKLLMLNKEGHISIELVAPVNEKSPSYRLLKQNGEHIYHLCYRVRSINEFINYLNEKGIIYEIISESKEAILFQNLKVCFVNIKGCGIIELLEDSNINSYRQSASASESAKYNDLVMIVTNDSNAAVTFFKSMGYYVIRNKRTLENMVEILMYNNFNDCIKLLSPQTNEGSYYEDLQEKGVYISDIGCITDSITTIKKHLIEKDYRFLVESGEKDNDIDLVIKLLDKPYQYYFSRKQEDISDDLITWDINKIKYDGMNHVEYITPLMYYTGKGLLKLPIHEIISNNVIKAEHVAARTEAEKRISEVWEEVLGVKKIGINDNFFELGGNSIKGVQIVSRLTMDFEIHLNDIFKFNTICILALNVPFKVNHFRENLKKMKDTAAKNQERNYTDDCTCVDKYKEYLDSIKNYNEVDYSSIDTYNTILFVGGTGYLGSHLVELLLKNTESNLYLLLRGDSEEAVLKKLENTFTYYFDQDLYKIHKSRIHILLGDFSKEYLGIEKERYETLANTIDCIFNSAANVKHYGKFDAFYESNVLGVKRLIDFAKEGRRKVIHHISTLNVAHGKVEDIDNFVFTEYDHDIGQEEENFYIKTKFEGEKLLVLAREEEQIQVNIYRVGNLVYSKSSKRFQRNIADNAFYTLIKSFVNIKSMPGLYREVLDFSFVDNVAQAVMLLFNKRVVSNETFHLFNPNRISFATLGEYLKETYPDMEVSEMGVFFDFLYDNFNNPLNREHILNILVHGYIMGDINDTNFYIMSDKTNHILQSLGFSWSLIGVNEVNELVAYCKEVNFI